VPAAHAADVTRMSVSWESPAYLDVTVSEIGPNGVATHNASAFRNDVADSAVDNPQVKGPSRASFVDHAPERNRVFAYGLCFTNGGPFGDGSNTADTAGPMHVTFTAPDGTSFSRDYARPFRDGGNCVRISASEAGPEQVKPITSADLAFEKYGRRLQMSGGGFLLEKDEGYALKRLSIWLPKGLAFAPAKRCSRATAQALTLDTKTRCEQLMGGRISAAGQERSAWFAVAGPSRSGGRSDVWLKARENDDLAGFGTGSIAPPSGGFGQRITLRLADLDIRTRSLEVLAEKLVASRSCKSPGRRYRIVLETSAGTQSATKNAKC
jgi:hypothetical protein